MTTEQEMENIVDPVYTDNSNTLNPLQKLMEGFCKKGAERVIGLTESDQDQKNCTDKVGTIKSNLPKAISELTTDGLTNDNSKAPTNPSPTSPDTTTATTTTTTTTTTTKQESRPEIEVSKRVTMMRRKRGIENFIMACIFVLTTLLSLKKLGFTTTDFGDFISVVGGSGGSNNYDDTGSSSSSSKSWIHIFDKKLLSIEKGKIEVKKTVTTTTTTEEQPTSIDETAAPPESVPAAEEKGNIDEEDATEDDSYDSYDDDDEEDATEDDSYDSYDDDDEEKD
ncbi:hypothetical protein FRACYDRAFT_232812 [Fragilariopsis cylindrus CCMP1102]|uniref:Uncharacterized protein n=1 Tax=Fragilariopsis cylindrus CCMP1102 TaxID=635003 RepID=A0A1E7FWZ5_9STRA|nr:hypothetical protein FRACYDRAFT_232812 [Fragilariopsis cylindrus CCMP1102]|eukprot:OEU22654.1 hypothetical protein FRACYDRAFT_232812 [Fragilariopsis cylindrus CCMP1102]